ncbi:MAG: HD domain-containing phosphohydrolase [Pseudomonadota bacterium]
MVCHHNISSTIRILCLDGDEEAIRKYQDCFSSKSYAAYYAQKAEQGFALAKKEIPDLIFYDIQLVGKKDFSVYQQIETNSFLRQSVMILVSTSVKELQDWMQGADLPGVHDYLIKPIQKDELLLKVNMSIRAKHLQDNFLKSNQKLDKALRYIKRIKADLEKANSESLSEKAMLENSLRQISLIIDDRSRINQKLEKLSETHQQSVTGMVDILSAMMDANNRYHRGHSRKVAEIACFIAKEFNLPDPTIRYIEMASLLYELGRLSLPDKIARKIPYDYSSAERAFIRNQPVETASLLNRFSGFQEVSRIIRHFHENCDGTGIPDGLKRNEIPIGSRILAGADLYDYLVYRRKVNDLHDVFQLIEKEVNTRLDAQVVHVLHQYAKDHPVNSLERARQVKMYELEPGMELAAGIYTQSGAKLLPMNTILRKDLILQLAQYAEREALEENVFIKDASSSSG